MRTSSDQRGFALESTLIMMVLLLALVGAAVATTVMIQKTSNVEYRAGRVQYAAEAAADAVMDQLQTATQDGLLTDAELAALTAPSVPGFTYSAINATRVGGTTQETIQTGDYKGLYGLNQRIDLNVDARDQSNNHSNVVVSLNAQSIPLFQFGVFFGGDLEIHNGARLDFAGWVHTNGNLFLGSDAGSYFHDMVTTPKKVYRRRKTSGASAVSANGVWIDNAGGTSKNLNFDSETVTNAATFRSRSASLVDDRLKTDAYSLSTLSLPLPAGMQPIVIIDPQSGGDAPAVRAVKYSWLADMAVTIDLNAVTPANLCNAGGAGVGIMTRNGTAKFGGMTPAECNNIFLWTTNAFQEGREGFGVDVLDINVGALMDWFDAGPAARMFTFGNGLGSIMYVTFTNAWNGAGWNAAVNNKDFPVVRLSNGWKLKYKLTVATDRPVYVKGNYNSEGPATVWRAAAIIGDGVTFLSPDWLDANRPWPTIAQCAALNPASPPNYDASPSNPAADCTNQAGAAPPANFVNGAGQLPAGTPANTMIVQAAVLAGNSRTCNEGDVACSGPYGGGLENFPRFLEDWGGGKTMQYAGSLVSLFGSRYSNVRGWSWRTYYGAPTRDWSFDTRFSDPMQLPPGTPVVTNITQTAYRPVY